MLISSYVLPGKTRKRDSGLLSLWRGSAALGRLNQEGNPDSGSREKCLPRANPRGGSSWYGVVSANARVCERGGAERGKQAATPSTALESLFSTRPLYLVSNISPGKRQQFSGRSLGNSFSSFMWFTLRLLEHSAIPPGRGEGPGPLREEEEAAGVQRWGVERPARTPHPQAVTKLSRCGALSVPSAQEPACRVWPCEKGLLRRESSQYKGPCGGLARLGSSPSPPT